MGRELVHGGESQSPIGAHREDRREPARRARGMHTPARRIVGKLQGAAAVLDEGGIARGNVQPARIDFADVGQQLRGADTRVAGVQEGVLQEIVITDAGARVRVHVESPRGRVQSVIIYYSVERAMRQVEKYESA